MRSVVTRCVSRAYSTGSQPAISSTLLLSRNPIITSDLPAFESQYYKYQHELLKRLMWTFPKWFYFREGTLAEQRYRQLNKDPVDNNPDIEFPRGRPEIRHNRDRRFKQEIRLPKTYKEADQLDGSEAPVDTKNDLARKIVPNPRVTEADKANDQTSLERKLSRTLYLVVSQDNKTWTFPEFTQQEELKPLDVLAEQGLTAIGGDKINYFNVSNTPCHVHIKPNKKSYLIKSHILSGEFIPTDSKLKFLWLTKQELSEKLSNEYYNEIEHLLNEY